MLWPVMVQLWWALRGSGSTLNVLLLFRFIPFHLHSHDSHDNDWQCLNTQDAIYGVLWFPKWICCMNKLRNPFIYTDCDTTILFKKINHPKKIKHVFFHICTKSLVVASHFPKKSFPIWRRKSAVFGHFLLVLQELSGVAGENVFHPKKLASQ